MTNLLEQAINADDGDDAAKLIRNALGIELVPKKWPDDRDQRARIIGEWLQTERGSGLRCKNDTFPARLVAFASALQLVLVAHPTQGAETPTTMRCH